MTPTELLKQMESEGAIFRIMEDEIEIFGPQDLVMKFWDSVVENESAIYEILVERAIFEPLIQDPDLYKVPHYTDAEKNRMIENYIQRVILEIKADEWRFEREIQGRLFRNAIERKEKEES